MLEHCVCFLLGGFLRARPCSLLSFAFLIQAIAELLPWRSLLVRSCRVLPEMRSINSVHVSVSVPCIQPFMSSFTPYRSTLLSTHRICPAHLRQVIKRFIMHSKKTAFIVEHDFIMATYLADRVIVYDGQPSKNATARSPQSLLTGMNSFLKNLDITFRRDPTNFRPRINKLNSTKDREQKDAGTFYYIGD